jgi:hydroxyethylthiazole kinase-like uncharacterized protein yjeF
MNRGITRAEMAELDRRATAEFGIPSLLLMENAGLRAADVVRQEMAARGAQRARVVCGRGNNGGDGFVVARHLANSGLATEVAFCGPPEGPAPGDAAVNADILRRMGISLHSVSDRGSLEVLPGDLVVDAIFGTGLKGDVRGLERRLIEGLIASRAPVVAIDVPSGLDVDRGVALGVAIRADVTVTFALPKRGFYLADGPGLVGRVVVVDISIPRVLLAPHLGLGERFTGRS